MKVGFFADGPWSQKSLEKITKNKKIDISFIVPRYENPDPILKAWAKKLSVDFIIEKNINIIESIKKLDAYEADLFVSMSYNQIIKKELLNIPSKGFINCHAGALPFYRGRSVLNWVLINGEIEYGVTVHYIDEGIDTGDIIQQEKYVIDDKDDYCSLLSKAENNCATLLDNALKNILDNKVNRVKQDSIDKVGSYFPQRKIGDEIINWNQESHKIINFVRALISPGPYAQSFYKNLGFIKIHNLTNNYINSNNLDKPGTIVGLEKNLPIIKTLDGYLKIEKFSSENNLILFNKSDLGYKFD